MRCGTRNRTSKLGMIFVCTGAITKLLLAGLYNRTFGTTPLSLSMVGWLVGWLCACACACARARARARARVRAGARARVCVCV